MNAPTSTERFAEFNPLIRPYLVVTIGFTMAATIIGLPLAVIWLCGVGQWWARHYFAKLECHLGEKALRYRNDILAARDALKRHAQPALPAAADAGAEALALRQLAALASIDRRLGEIAALLETK